MFFLQALDQVTDLNDLLRVKSYCRLIQDNDFRIAQDCLCQTNSLAITFGKIFDQTVFHVCDLYHIHDFFDLFIFLVSWDFFQICRKFHIFKNCHIKIERRHFRQIADAFLSCFWFFQNIMTIDHYFSFCGCNVSCDHVHCC